MNYEKDIQAIFAAWNKYRGRGYGKIRWKSHTVLARPIIEIIKWRLAPAPADKKPEYLTQGYDAETLMEAIDNYAHILLSPSYKWSPVWTLVQFLGRRSMIRPDEEHLTRFLPGLFELDDYITEQARMIRARVTENAEPIVPLTLEEKQAIRANFQEG